MGFDVFTVELQGNAPVYFSGQQIRGFVRAVASTSVTCLEIKVELRGKAKVHWTEHRNKRTYTYSNREDFGMQTLSLWNGALHDNSIEPGNHTFPFMFVLPQNIPSSFETSHGAVHYNVRATANRNWSLNNVEKAYFNVHHIYDLNLEHEARLPINVDKESNAGCCCCKQGPIDFEMSVDHRGYVPGEKMFINGNIKNHTVTSIKYTEAKIIQHVTLHATDKTKIESTTVQRVYRPSIRPGGHDVWSRVPLTIPAVCPSGLRNCRIIDVSYELRFLAKLGCCKAPSANADLIIGSVAFNSGYQHNLQPGAQAEQILLNQNMRGSPSMQPGPPMAPYYQFNDAPPPYPDTAPPSYEASKQSRGPYDEDDDEGGFVPKQFEKNYNY